MEINLPKTPHTHPTSILCRPWISFEFTAAVRVPYGMDVPCHMKYMRMAVEKRGRGWGCCCRCIHDSCSKTECTSKLRDAEPIPSLSHLTSKFAYKPMDYIYICTIYTLFTRCVRRLYTCNESFCLFAYELSTVPFGYAEKVGHKNIWEISTARVLRWCVRTT